MGRRKLYNREAILDALTQCFWQHGYEGTSLQDLEKATGMPKQSLYREFSSKSGMYAATLAHYERHEVRTALALVNAQAEPMDGLRALFSSILAEAGQPDGRRGCFLCNAAVDRTGIDLEIGNRVQDALRRLRDAFAKSLALEKDQEHIADTLLAGYVGLRSLVRNDWPVGALRKVADDLLETIASR